MTTKYYSTDKFYKDPKWIKKRMVILRRDEYGCQECTRYGKTTLATTVHHIFPLDLYPELRLVNDNLISLCNQCHEQMHNRITNEITKIGFNWQNRIKKKSKIIQKYFSA